MIGLVSAKVFHARVRPRRNRFSYSATYLTVPLSDFARRSEGLFAIDRANLFNLRSSDYGEGGEPARWISQVLKDCDVPQADGEVILLTMPRVFGYAFNPVNFWLCHDRNGSLRAVLAEVNNTFGERHSYLCAHSDRRTIAPFDVVAIQKAFHVSPFMPMDGDYSFRFSVEANRIAIQIDLADKDGLLLRTSIAGPIRPMTGAALLQKLFLNPTMPIKVIALIHYQALRLFLKRVRHFPKPAPPTTPVSVPVSVSRAD